MTDSTDPRAGIAVALLTSAWHQDAEGMANSMVEWYDTTAEDQMAITMIGATIGALCLEYIAHGTSNDNAEGFLQNIALGITVVQAPHIPPLGHPEDRKLRRAQRRCWLSAAAFSGALDWFLSVAFPGGALWLRMAIAFAIGLSVGLITGRLMHGHWLWRRS